MFDIVDATEENDSVVRLENKSVFMEQVHLLRKVNKVGCYVTREKKRGEVYLGVFTCTFSLKCKPTTPVVHRTGVRIIAFYAGPRELTASMGRVGIEANFDWGGFPVVCFRLQGRPQAVELSADATPEIRLVL